MKVFTLETLSVIMIKVLYCRDCGSINLKHYLTADVAEECDGLIGCEENYMIMEIYEEWWECEECGSENIGEAVIPTWLWKELIHIKNYEKLKERILEEFPLWEL